MVPSVEMQNVKAQSGGADTIIPRRSVQGVLESRGSPSSHPTPEHGGDLVTCEDLEPVFCKMRRIVKWIVIPTTWCCEGEG